MNESQFSVVGSKPGARCPRLSAQLKPKSKSLDSTDKEEEEEEQREEEERARCAKKGDEEDDVFTKPDEEGKRTGVK